MKKLFLMGLAAAGMLLTTSCSSDETVEQAKGSAIGFSSFVNKSTRGASDDVTLANLGSIEVYGWRGDNLIFDKQEVKVATNGEGTYSPLQYWEANYTYKFEAIAPKSGDKGVTFAADKDGGKITFENNATTDLLYAKAADVTMGKEITAQPEKVNFTFKHQLARVMFTFKNTFPEGAAAKITVKDVKIIDAYSKGEITPATTDAKWTVDEANKNFSITFAPSAENSLTSLAAFTGKGATDHMYLIPTGVASKYKVTFVITLDQNGATTDYTHEVEFTTTQEQGKSYNYIAEINNKNINPDTEMYPIEFKAEVSDWAGFADQTPNIK